MTAIAATVTEFGSGERGQHDVRELQQLDPAGELQDAFESFDDCKSLGDQLQQSVPDIARPDHPFRMT